MATLNEAVEIVRDRHLMNVLEEGTVTSELDVLKTKKFLTENLSFIKKILVEEGVVDGAKDHLKNNWGKYALGAGALGAGVGLGEYGAAQGSDFGHDIAQGYHDGGKTFVDGVGGALSAAGKDIANGADRVYNNVHDYFSDPKANVPIPKGAPRDGLEIVPKMSKEQADALLKENDPLGKLNVGNYKYNY